jgi:primosomal protein N' (replication factor Y) (superfamily II helicase)
MTCGPLWASEPAGAHLNEGTAGRRYVRIRTDVAAVPKLFDYAVPERWTETVTVGTRVRAVLNGRRVGGWVTEDNVTPPVGVTPTPLTQWSGWGPPAMVVELAEWAAWRWAGPVSFFLKAASPAHVVRTLPEVPQPPRATAPRITPGEGDGSNVVTELTVQALRTAEPALLRLPPTTDLIDAVLTVVNDPDTREKEGTVLVLVPSLGWAERLVDRLVRRGLAATTEWAKARAGWPIVVGSRSGAWAPVPRLAAALVLDAHDEAFREESAPTYSAVDVVIERASREGSRCLLISPAPPVVLSAGRVVMAPPSPQERAGWATVELVDRRGADPRTGLFSEEFVRLARSVLDDPDSMARRGPLVCVFNRTGRSLLLACRRCGELAQCTNCSAAVRQVGDLLHCPRCHQERPMVCAACGHLRMKTLRTGVSRLREEVAALLQTEVDEVSGATDRAEPPAAPVLMGTEAVLHRVRRAAAVAFLDIDLHLLAPRFSATDETLALLIHASRLVGPRHVGPPTARLLVQTRVPDHPVLAAVARGDPSAVMAEEESIRRSSGLPPFSALAALSGPLAGDYAAALEAAGARRDVTVSDLPDDGRLIRAPDSTVLSDLLAEVPRPAGRGLRIEVDPTAI